MADEQNRTSDEERIGAAWDRVGGAMGAAGEVASALFWRNIEGWNQGAAHLRDEPRAADKMGAGAGRVLAATVDSARDVWTAWSSPPFGMATDVAPTRSVF